MRNKYLILLTLGVFFSTFISAMQKDEKASVILKKMAEIKKTNKGIKGTFYYIFENKEENVLEKSKGLFLFKGDKYWVDILGVETFFDTQYIYSFMKDANEVTIQEPDEDTGLTPSNLFDRYENGFSTKYIGKENIAKNPIHVIELFPLDKASKNYNKIRVKINAKTYLPRSIETFGKTGDNVRIEVSQIESDIQNVKDSNFHFQKEKYPEVEIIDMR